MTIYRVNDIYTTIQGEGVLTGVPMILLRLHGCGVGCPWCDTKETWTVDTSQRWRNIEDALGANERWCDLSGSEIAAYIKENHPGPEWVLVTGGEPAEQDLETLTSALHDAGYKVALETSGTAIGHLKVSFDWVCVSPKINMPGGKAIIPAAVRVADEIKHVVGKQSDIDNLRKLIADCGVNGQTTICVQPVSKNEKATQLCIETVQKTGWRLSIQMHKYIGVA